jgi:hypothetical protein
LVLLSTICLIVAGCAAGRHNQSDKGVISGELKQWHTVTLTLTGPQASETSRPNPFLDYRLTVTFSQDVPAAKGEKSSARTPKSEPEAKRYVVPGYYAADGNAGQTGAAIGDKWQVKFLPPETGKWKYVASFRIGKDIAINPAAVGEPVACDGARGSFEIAPTDKTGRDFRGQGQLRYIGQRYLQFAQTRTYFIKAGADSPENFLGYADFDGTYDSGGLKREGEAKGGKFIHHYQPHVQDWQSDDPTWKDGKGKGIIGALNYLASKGMNSVYFLTYNVDGGDGKDVWPWVDPNDKLHFDCSKLAQWEIVFSHMDKVGLMLHVVTQETENDQALDGGELGRLRKLYYRELIARFAHHPALVWNLGEENSNTDIQRKAFARYIRNLDPYDHPIVCHTFPGQYDEVYKPLLGYENFEGPSLQTNDTHTQTLKWIDESAAAGRPWVVCLDEIGPPRTGVKPDNDDYWHDEVRKQHLWGNLMAGGAGGEWYFGYQFAHNDLNCENWRSRDHMWDLTRYALEFFQNYLQFARMYHHDELTSVPDDYCLASPGYVYAIYLPTGGTTDLDLGPAGGTFRIRWFNPRQGGPTEVGTLTSATGPGRINIGQPPRDTDKDWIALVDRAR